MTEYLTVKNIVWYGEGIFEIRFERNGIEFVPGDCIALFSAEGKESRPYSVASGRDEDILRFVIRHMEGGMVSPYLASRKPGDTVKISPPFGWFRPGRTGASAPFVFLTTGTGISPFLSHFRSHPEHPPLQCLYGVRVLEDAVDLEWLRTLCNLKLAVSREGACPHHQGRITDLLDDMPVAPEIHYYLCGLDAMIDEVTNWLEEKGIDIAHIHRECFFNASY